VIAQFPPPPEGVKVIESKFGNGVTISYKEVRTDWTFQVNYKKHAVVHSIVDPTHLIADLRNSPVSVRPRKVSGRTQAMSTCPLEL